MSDSIHDLVRALEAVGSKHADTLKEILPEQGRDPEKKVNRAFDSMFKALLKAYGLEMIENAVQSIKNAPEKRQASLALDRLAQMLHESGYSKEASEFCRARDFLGAEEKAPALLALEKKIQGGEYGIEDVKQAWDLALKEDRFPDMPWEATQFTIDLSHPVQIAEHVMYLDEQGRAMDEADRSVKPLPLDKFMYEIATSSWKWDPVSKSVWKLVQDLEYEHGESTVLVDGVVFWDTNLSPDQNNQLEKWFEELSLVEKPRM